MSVIYNLTCINNRLQAVSATIDAGGSNGNLVLLANSTVISKIPLARPSGTVNGGVLTFSGAPLTALAIASGTVTTAQFQDSNGVIVIYGLSVGPVGASADIVISNGSNSTVITSGESVDVLAAQITGS